MHVRSHPHEGPYHILTLSSSRLLNYAQVASWHGHGHCSKTDHGVDRGHAPKLTDPLTPEQLCAQSRRKEEPLSLRGLAGLPLA